MKARYCPCLGVKRGSDCDIVAVGRLSVLWAGEAWMNIRYHVDLSEAERAELRALVGGGRQAARKIKRGQILLAADAGISDEEIAASVAVGTATVFRTRRRFVEGDLEAALSEQPRPGAARKLSGKEEALLVATACSHTATRRSRSSGWMALVQPYPICSASGRPV